MVQIIDLVRVAAGGFSLSEGIELLKPLSIFIVGMIIYSVFIFKFYRFVARRDVFKYSGSEKISKGGKFISGASYVFKYIFLMPLVIFFWFIVLSVILAFLSKQEGAQMVLLVSIALIATIRVVSYYSEDLSKDLSKMLPFALLGIFLVDISFFSAQESFNSIMQIPALWNMLVYYLIFLILLELVLRIVFGILSFFIKDKKSSKDDEGD